MREKLLRMLILMKTIIIYVDTNNTDENSYGSVGNPPSFFLFKINNGNTKSILEICSKLTIKTPEQRHGRCFGVYIINREYISHFILLFMTLLARARPFL